MSEFLSLTGSASQRKRMLLLEDDKQLSGFIKEFLASESWIVVAVENGVEGFLEIQKSDFDAIVCDIVMPKLSGDQFYRAVEGAKPHLCSRFIFLSGMSTDSRIIAFIKEVRAPVLGKPFDLHRLIGALEQVSGARSSAGEWECSSF